MTATPKSIITIRLDPAVYAAVVEAAHQAGISITAYIQAVLRMATENRR